MTSLSDSSTLSELALAAAEVSVWQADLVGLTTQFDARLSEILGRPLQEPVPDAEWAKLVHPDDAETVHRTWVGLLRGDVDRYECELRVAHADGSWRWLRSRAGVVGRDSNGRALSAAGTYVDITAAKTNEDALAAAEADAAGILKASGDGIFLVDRAFRVLRVNPDAQAGMLRFYGHGASEGVSLLDQLGESERSFVEEQLQHVMVRGRAAPIERQLMADGVPVWLEFVFAPVHLANGELRGAAVVIRDVDRRKRAEAALIQAEKTESLGLLAGGIAHDFNNLLVAVLGNIGLALEEAPSSSTSFSTLKDAERAAERAAELANQLLAYAGRSSRRVEHFDLGEMVGEIAQLLKVAIGANVRFTFDFLPSLPLAEGDVTQLRQVVMNLVVNARDAIGSSSGEIVATTAVRRITSQRPDADFVGAPPPAGDYVSLDLSDTGGGMTPEIVARIFDPFFTTKPNGRGLGLAAALGTVRAHGGALTVKSRPGSGTTFRLLLPVAAGARSRPSPTTAAEERKAAGTVLVVDDDANVRAVTTRALTLMGFSTVEADDGESALTKATELGEGLVCVVMDVTMPGMSGIDAARELQSLRPEVPVILLSGFAGDVVGEDASSSVRAFLQKPYRLAELRDAVKDAVESARWGL